MDIGVPHFNAPAGGDLPANIRINFTSLETIKIVLPDAGNHTIVSSFVWTQYRNVTDGRTDGQTDGNGLASIYTALCTASNTGCRAGKT